MSITVILEGAEGRKELCSGRAHVQAYCGVRFTGATSESGIGLRVLTRPMQEYFVSAAGPCRPLRLWRSMQLLERVGLHVVTAGALMACLEAGHTEWREVSDASKHLLANKCEGGLEVFRALCDQVHDEYPTPLIYEQLRAGCALAGVPLDYVDDPVVRFFHVSRGYLIAPVPHAQLSLQF